MAILISTQITGSLIVTSTLNALGGVTGSLLGTASYALATSPVATYVTLATGSNNYITCSFLDGNESITLVNSALYTFTSSNHPSNGQVANLYLHISHSATSTSSLAFPESWTNLGAGWPTYISASKMAIIWLRCMDTSMVMGTYTVQL